MRWILRIGGTLVGLIAVLWLIGMTIAQAHTASRSLQLKQPPEAIWRALTDYAAMPSWRSNLSAVDRLPDANGHEVWRETQKGGDAIPLETVEAVPPRRLVRKIADPNLPFGGTWTYELSPDGTGCTLTITENGEVYNPIFRVVGKFMDQSAHITEFLEALARKFSEEPRFVVRLADESPPRRVPIQARELHCESGLRL